METSTSASQTSPPKPISKVSEEQSRNTDLSCFSCEGTRHIASICHKKMVVIVKKKRQERHRNKQSSTCQCYRDTKGLSLMIRFDPEWKRSSFFGMAASCQKNLYLLIIDGGSAKNLVYAEFANG